MDENSSIFVNALAIVELRNALFHYKSTWDEDRPRKRNFIAALTGQYDLSSFVDSGSDFVTMRTMSGACMRWVVINALAFLREFDSRTRLDDKKMSQFWHFETP